MTRTNRNIASLAAIVTLAAACGGPVDAGNDEPLVIITTDGTETNDPDSNLDPNPDPDANNTPDPETNNDPDPDPDPDPNTNNDPDPDPDPNTNNDPDPDPNTNNDPDPDPEPCGDGVIEDGETCDGDCPTSCNDGNSCTTDTMMGSAEMCTAVCTNTFEDACTTHDGEYSGNYFIKAEEKLGSSVIHSVSCTGTFTATVDTSADDHVTGTAECDYPGSVGAFESNQTATITGSVSPDGSVELRIVHEFGTQRDGSFTVEGVLSGSTINIDDTGSFYPHPMSAVPWQVELKLD